MRRISNAEMKRIVSLTCKEIRVTGQYNKSINRMANAYRIDSKILSKLVSARKDLCEARKQRTYKYYVAIILYDFRKSYGDNIHYDSMLWSTECQYKDNIRYRVVRALNEYKAINYLTQDNPLINQNGDYIWVKKLIPFSSQSKADSFKNKIKWEDIRIFVLPKSLK